jgi:hypothetical protein
MITIPAILESIRSLKDKTYKVVFETNELTPEQMSGIAQNLQIFGWLAFKEAPFGERDKSLLDSLKVDYDDTGKTKGQRLRAVLYRWFEVEPQGYEVFDDFYNHHMEKMIMHFKQKLP